MWTQTECKPRALEFQKLFKRKLFFNKSNDKESKQYKACCRDIFEGVNKMKNPFIYQREEEEGGRIKKEQKEMKKNSELSNVSKS